MGKMKKKIKCHESLKQENDSSPMHVPIYYVNYPEDGNILLMFT